MKKKLFAIILLILIGFMIFNFKNIKNILQTSEQNSISKNLTREKITEKSSAQDNIVNENKTKETLDKIQPIQQKETNANESGDSYVEPASLESAMNEHEILVNIMESENVFSRLKDNLVSEDERKRYVEIFNKLALLNSYITEKKTEQLREKFKTVEAEYEKNMQAYR